MKTKFRNIFLSLHFDVDAVVAVVVGNRNLQQESTQSFYYYYCCLQLFYYYSYYLLQSHNLIETPEIYLYSDSGRNKMFDILLQRNQTKYKLSEFDLPKTLNSREKRPCFEKLFDRIRHYSREPTQNMEQSTKSRFEAL